MITRTKEKQTRLIMCTWNQLLIFLLLLIFFIAKLELLRKTIDFLLQCVALTIGVSGSNIIFVLRFKKSNKLYCAQAAKIIKSKYVVKGSKVHPVFIFQFFNNKRLKRKSENQLTGLELVHI